MQFSYDMYTLLFKEITSKTKVKSIETVDYYRELFDSKNKLRIKQIIRKSIKENPKIFNGFIKLLKNKLSLIDPKKPIVIFETGAFGTSLKFSQYLLEILFPDRKIYTSIVYSHPSFEKNIDFIYHGSSGFAAYANNFENYPKIKKGLSSINLSRKGKIYEKRSEPKGYTDRQDYLFESKIFNLALGNMLVYKNKGIDISNPFFQERYIDALKKIDVSLGEKY
jgi:hypothetical protein